MSEPVNAVQMLAGITSLSVHLSEATVAQVAPSELAELREVSREVLHAAVRESLADLHVRMCSLLVQLRECERRGYPLEVNRPLSVFL